MALGPQQVNSASAFALSQLPAGLQAKQMDTFSYVVEILPAAASVSTIGSVTINNDADFLWISCVGTVTDTANATFLANVPSTVLITDNGAGRAISSSAVHWNNFFGTALYPNTLDFAKFLARGTSMTFQYNNLEATARNVRIALRGFKIFSYQ